MIDGAGSRAWTNKIIKIIEVLLREAFPDKPPGFQLVLWDTNARINGLVATDLETLVSEVLRPLPSQCWICRWAFHNDHSN